MSDHTVLIVEDNDKNRKLMRDLLRMNGYQYLEAEDGLAGVEAAREHHPDLILMDIQLPGLDGSESRMLKNFRMKSRCSPAARVNASAAYRWSRSDFSP